MLLKNNALFPWLILVPEVEGIEDLHLLDEVQYAEVMAATRQVSAFVSDYFQPEKLNIGCIGNQVRQMHIHIIGRSADDPAWPGTVWAFEGKRAHTEEEISTVRAAARAFLKLP